jgi:ribosome modulation factor
MAGNARAKLILAKASGQGRSAKEVEADVAETFDGLSRFDRAWALGYLARLVDKPREKNPFDTDADEIAAKCHARWVEGWNAAAAGDFAELSRRVAALRGGE